MTNHTMELMYGLKPVHRDNPQAGESEWYYYDPRGTDNFSDMKKIDVPSENSPNPYADEIQNYLYKNDRYNYNQLYGTTPPPITQPAQPQPTGWSNVSNNNLGFGSSTIGQHIDNAINQFSNVQKNNGNLSNLAGNVVDLYNDIKQDYFGSRNYQNRYKQGCTPSNVAYNTISNYQISSNPKLVENGNIVSNFSMQKVLSKIPIAGKYINRIAIGEKIGNGLANFYNALDEAGCFK